MKEGPKMVVFLGPSLPLADARLLLPAATFRGPARLGDVYLACRDRPAAILIIDGLFDQELAVWHKEVLWALAHGVRVYGAASMGALRAAELAAFGMVGVGSIFEAFSQGVLEDDDEVAVAHGDADGGYRLLSEAMVDIRATLLRAQQEGLIDQPTRDRLIRRGKEMFYPERSLAAILVADGERGPATDRLRRWLEQCPSAKVAQKRQDAEAALRRLATDSADYGDPGPPPGFRFEYTEAWHEFRRTVERPGS